MKKIILYLIAGIGIGILAGLSNSPIASQIIALISTLILSLVELSKKFINTKNESNVSVEKKEDHSLLLMIIGITIGVFLGIELKFFEMKIHEKEIDHFRIIISKDDTLIGPIIFESGKTKKDIYITIDTSDIESLNTKLFSSGDPFLMKIVELKDTLAMQSYILGYRANHGK
jgi:hypothetical protein